MAQWVDFFQYVRSTALCFANNWWKIKVKGKIKSFFERLICKGWKWFQPECVRMKWTLLTLNGEKGSVVRARSFTAFTFTFYTYFLLLHIYTILYLHTILLYNISPARRLEIPFHTTNGRFFWNLSGLLGLPPCCQIHNKVYVVCLAPNSRGVSPWRFGRKFSPHCQTWFSSIMQDFIKYTLIKNSA